MAVGAQALENAPARRPADVRVLVFSKFSPTATDFRPRTCNSTRREVTKMRTANELATFLGATILGNGNLQVSGVANPDGARAEDLIYVDSPRHLERAASSEAWCVLVPEGTKLAGKTTLKVKNPKFAFAKAAAWLAP